jgi:hypothetical protein
MPKCCTILFLFCFKINLKSGQLSDRSAGWCCWFNVVGIVIITIRSKKRKNNFSVEFLRSIFKVVCSCHLVDDAIRCQLQLIFTQIRKKKKRKLRVSKKEKRHATQITSNHHLIFLCFQIHTAKSKFGLFVSFGNFFGGDEEIVKCFFLFF